MLSTIALRDASGERVTELDAGAYLIVVTDRSLRENFHLLGPDIDRRTGRFRSAMLFPSVPGIRIDPIDLDRNFAAHSESADSGARQTRTVGAPRSALPGRHLDARPNWKTRGTRVTARALQGSRSDTPLTYRARNCLQRGQKARRQGPHHHLGSCPAMYPFRTRAAMSAVGSTEKSLQIRLSRRADSNRGPLHYE